MTKCHVSVFLQLILIVTCIEANEDLLILLIAQNIGCIVILRKGNNRQFNLNYTTTHHSAYGPPFVVTYVIQVTLL